MLDTWLVCNGHKGVNQQGNKSLLSFRTGYGQPGYTGYIPAVEAIPYSVKDETKRLVRTASLPLLQTVRSRADRGCCGRVAGV